MSSRRFPFGGAGARPWYTPLFFSTAIPAAWRLRLFDSSISPRPKRTEATIWPTTPERSICWVTETTLTFRPCQSARSVSPSRFDRARRSSFQRITVLTFPAKISFFSASSRGRELLSPLMRSSLPDHFFDAVIFHSGRDLFPLEVAILIFGRTNIGCGHGRIKLHPI